MPSIIVVADTENDQRHAHLREQVPAAIMVDPRSAGALIERIAFALAAAEQAERTATTRQRIGDEPHGAVGHTDGQSLGRRRGPDQGMM